MKKRIFLIISFFIFGICFSQTDTTFTSLRGFQDSTGNTYLYYIEQYSKHNIDEVSDNLYVDSTIFIHNIFNVETETNFQITRGSETIYYPENHLQQSRIADIEFIDNDPKKYIYAVNSLGIDPDGRIYRYEHNYSDQDYVAGILGHFDDIYISPNNSNHIYAIAGNWIIHSQDSGISWENFNIIPNSSPYIKKLVFSPSDESIMFGISSNNLLLKSRDTSKTFVEVSYLENLLNELYEWEPEYQFLFDCDKKHIYLAINNSVKSKFTSIKGILIVSDSSGNYGTWKLESTFQNPIQLAIDDSVSGSLFLSTDNSIYQSNDYGKSFFSLADLPHHANSLYKYPKENILFATTNNGIIKISDDSVSYIKSRSIKKSLQYFPIEIGNKWVYNTVGVSYDIEPHPFNYNTTEIVKKDSLHIGKHYFYIENQSSYHGYWIRVDSINGSIYKRDHLNYEVNETVLYNLAAYEGDLLEIENGIIYNVENSDTMLWDKVRYKKTFHMESLLTPSQTFVQGIGMVESIGEFDFGHSLTRLIECTIGGITYNDTVVGIKNEPNSITSKFSLSQNYPNPFNPTTIIKYQISNNKSQINSKSQGSTRVMLKVYDVLGKEVTTLVNETKQPGTYHATFNANNLASGMYYYRLSVGDFSETKKMILLK